MLLYAVTLFYCVVECLSVSRGILLGCGIFQVVDVHLVVDPWTRESRGFGFVTMETVKEADRCIKYLNHSVLEGRVITVEKVTVLDILFLFVDYCMSY